MNDRDGDGSSLEWIDEELIISDEDTSVDTEPLSGPDDDDFEETNVETRHIVNRYDPVCDHGENMFTLGMRFACHEQFKNAVKKYAVINGFDISWQKSEERRMIAKCVEGCGWRLYGSWIQNEKTFIIKRVGDPHNCNRSLTNKQATATWLAHEYMPKIRDRLTYKAAEMQADARERFALTLDRKKCYRAISKALSLIRGPIEEQYDMLRSYLAELKRVSKDGTFEMEVDPVTKVFERFYVGFTELKSGFLAGCRRVIGLDGCFLKTGLKGILLCAVGRDGNNQMFPIAWAVVEVESEASWTWFLTLLFADLMVCRGNGWTFISDQQKGLMNAVLRLSPQAEHRNCARHIYANWKKLHKGDAPKHLFWRAVSCTFQADFDLATAELKMECPKGYEDFMRQGPEHFSMNGNKMWPKVNGEPVKPPPYRRKRGREKKNRIKDKDERSSDGKKLYKVGVQMRCTNCLQYGHNKKTCKNPTSLRPPKAKRGRPKKVTSAQTNAQASEQSNGDSPIIRKEMVQAQQGYGLFIAAATGNSYLRMPGSDRVIHIGGPSISNGQTLARNVQVPPSQSSIDASEPSCTQESGIGGL